MVTIRLICYFSVWVRTAREFSGAIDRGTDSLTGVIQSEFGDIEAQGKRLQSPLVGDWRLDISSERRDYAQRLRAPNKTPLHSSGLLSVSTASGCIDHPQMACFTFLGRQKTARFRCDNSFC